MKSLLLTLSLAAAAVSTSQAQYYRPSVVRDTTVLGAVAGALIGGHNNDHWAQGAVIGAAAGALIGSAIDDSGPRGYRGREIRSVEVAPCAPVYGSAPTVVYGNAPAVVYAPAPRVVYVQPYPRTVIVGRPGVYITDNRYYGHGHRGYDHRRDRRDNRRW